MNFLNFIQWRPGIGDPDFMGWFITCAYLIVAMMSGLVCIRGERFFPIHEIKKQRIFWGFFGVVFLFLGVNKQLDLQSLLRDVGKALAVNMGWYDQRRIVQFWFVIIMGIIFFILLLIAAFWVIRNGLKTNMVAMLGLCIIMVFILVRASSFSHIEKIFGCETIRHKVELLLESGGIFCVAVNALMHQRSKD